MRRPCRPPPRRSRPALRVCLSWTYVMRVQSGGAVQHGVTRLDVQAQGVEDIRRIRAARDAAEGERERTWANKTEYVRQNSVGAPQMFCAGALLRCRLRTQYSARDAEWCDERDAAIAMQWHALLDSNVAIEFHKVRGRRTRACVPCAGRVMCSLWRR